MIKHLLLGWLIFAIFSLVVWGFSGISFWMPVTQDDAGRAMALILFHMGGFAAYPAYMGGRNL